MTNERTDHVALAKQLLEVNENVHGLDAIATAAEAQAHATLALVDQQRIANLIALSQSVAGDGSRPLRHLTVVPINEYDVGPRPEVAAALGIAEVQS